MAKDKPNLNNVECDSKNNNIGAEIKKMQKNRKLLPRTWMKNNENEDVISALTNDK